MNVNKNKKKNQETIKWARGILGLIIVPVAIWLIKERLFPPAPSCHLSGTVYEAENQQPLGNVKVLYISQGEAQSKYLTTTGNDGKFSARCDDQTRFPLTLVLTNRDWGTNTANTGEEVPANGKEDMNIYVPVGVVKNHDAIVKLITTRISP